ncbi:DNA-directed RNA polymerase subunit A' [Candidatus Woesearchaeota archaeon]|nr:DNA-directed RNA polymerase subunit A' [Candidatus Woesearchaeota archaeon]
MDNQAIYKKIGSIGFGLLDPITNKKMSAAKIVTPELYDREGYPVDGGLMDIRMGVIDPGLRCKTCGQKIKECPGHFGYMELARPVIHIKFVTLILSLLRGTCKNCGKILIPPEKIAEHAAELKVLEEEGGDEERRKFITDIIYASKIATKCPHCKAKQQKITLEKPYTFLEDDKRISPIEIRSRLEKISNEELAIMGVKGESARPEWAILTILAIPPVTMRPSITLETGERSEDDLTHKLGDIVRINQRLFENINAGAPEIIIEDLWDLLQYHVTTFFDNEIAQLPPARHRNGQPLKTITERIKSKEGRIRHNLAGKRTNFSARTVISPDPMLSINEVGVPELIARKLTVPERVTEWNLEYLKEFVKKGPENYPGSNYIIRPDGKKKKITSETQESCVEELQPGYVVERHLMDGDIAIFNRQPSLHRMSMMCHKVRILPGKTLRLNVAVCAPYNADFDGDEMNLHIPQTEEARAEAEQLMLVQTQIISPRDGLAVIGGTQDALSGNYLLTGETEFTRRKAIEILSSAGISEFSRLPKKEKITGKEIFSILIPEDFSFRGETKDGHPLIIKKGVLMEGRMDSANLGEGAGLFLRSIHKQYGPEFTADVLSKIFKLGIAVLMQHGQSAVLSDLDLPHKTKESIKKIIEEAEEKIDDLIVEYKKETMDTLPGRTLKETFETKCLETLNKARNKVVNAVSDSSVEGSHFENMVRSGGAGKFLHLTQMAACVGQQALRGGRISSGYKDRTLSAFKKGDLRAAARGFIAGGFKDGLKPADFFFMGITGRDGLMDTALRTPKSGYLYRRLANAMQDLRVEYDETVRDSGGKIIQFQYGEDGVDVSKSEKGKINVKRIVENATGGKTQSRQSRDVRNSPEAN